MYHNPYLINNKGNTVAMMLAEHEIIASKEWHHDP